MPDVKPSAFTQITSIADKDDSFIPHTQDQPGAPVDRTISYEDFLSSIDKLTTVTDINSDSLDILMVRQNSDSLAKDITVDNFFKGIHDVYIPAGAMWNSTTSGAADLAKSELSSGKDINTFDFDGATVESVQFEWSLPRSYDLSTITYTVIWTGAAGAGGVTWGLEAYAISNDDALDGTYGTRIDVDDTFIAANDKHKTSESSALTIGGTPASQDLMHFKLTRQVGDANDTKTEDAKLIGIILHVGVNKKASA